METIYLITISKVYEKPQIENNLYIITPSYG